MTTASQTPLLKPVRASSSRWRLALSAFGLTLLALGAVAVGGAVAYERSLDGRILPGVTVGGVALDGLERQAAEDRLLASLPDPAVGALTLEVGDEVRVLTYASLGRRYELSPALDAAISLGREGGALERASEHLRTLLRGEPFDVDVVYDVAVVDRAVTEMVAGMERTRKEARLRIRDGRYVAQPSATGVEVDEAALGAAAHDALQSLGNSTGPTRASVVPLVSEPTRRTDAAAAAADRANAMGASDVALLDGTTGHAIPVETVRAWLRVVPEADGSYTVDVPVSTVETALAELAEAVAVRPVDAGIAFGEGGSVVAVPGTDGRALDTAATAQRIVSALQERAQGAQTLGSAEPPVELVMSAVAARYTTAQAEAAAPQVERVSSWTTSYTVAESNFFGKNISVPTTKIHGQSVAPGRQFDFWKAVGTISRAEGYGPGGIIINGRTQPTGAVGGGICSCSTTIFNAALRAGLEMGERRNHSYYIDRYPVGLDATVFRSSSGSVQSMRFRNDTSHPLLIKGINRYGKVRFEIWTVPTGRTVTFSEPRIEDRRPARDTLEYTDDLAPGVRSRTEYPTEGFRSWVTRTVRDASGEVIHRETFYSNYISVDGITLVGRAPGDPPDGTIVVVG